MRIGPGIYLSSDELERTEAALCGLYDDIVQHPREIGALPAGTILVIDFDHILFDAKTEAIDKVIAAARAGVRVGIHTYHPWDVRLDRLKGEPNIVVETTHERVLTALRRMGPPRGGPTSAVAA